LGLSVYAYKTAIILAPAFLCLTVLLVALQAAMTGVKARRIVLMAAAATAGFVLATTPYVVDGLRHVERIAQFERAYRVADPRLNLLQNVHDLLRYDSIGNRLGVYVDSFNPRHLFFFGAGAWTDSTRRAGLFLLGTAVPMGVGLYVSLRSPRSLSRSLVAAGFLLAPLSNVILNEVTLRRMIPIAVFGALLAIEGWRFIMGRPRFGLFFAGVLAAATLGHFAWYYNDYMVTYPLNSYRAWELNLGEALQRLAERQQARGGKEQPLILVKNQYARDYAHLYLGDSHVLDRAEFRTVTPGSPADSEPSRLVLRQLLLDEREPVSEACPSWRVSEIIREPHGEPTFVVCERN
jgi:hypothetical protein